MRGGIYEYNGDQYFGDGRIVSISREPSTRCVPCGGRGYIDVHDQAEGSIGGSYAGAEDCLACKGTGKKGGTR